MNNDIEQLRHFECNLVPVQHSYECTILISHISVCMYILFHQKETSYSRWHLCQILTDFYWQIIYEICSKTATKNPTTHCICCHTTLWNINVRKQAINDKVQGSVATYLRRGGLSIITLRKVYCWVFEWKIFKIGEYLTKLQPRRWLSHALCVSGHHTA